MRSIWVATLVVVMVVALSPLGFSAGRTVIPIYTPGAGGTAYLAGGAIATGMNKYIPEVQMMVEATGGTAAMSKLMGEKAEKNQPAFWQLSTGRESIRTWAQKTHEVLRSSP
jgi:TRAP-type uncharacterized transport system substrate-binding protein